MTGPSVVFVTGASSGLGEAIARRFLAGGAKVILAARRRDRLETLAAAAGPNALPLELDLRAVDRFTEVLEALPPQFSEVDCLVNNAGLALGLSPAQTADPAHWRQMIETNCLGLAALTRAMLPGMVARGRGHVINIGSIGGTYPYPGGNVYAATKAFVHQFSLGLRSDLHGTGVRVTCVEPGMVGGTEFSNVRFSGDPAKAEAVYAGMIPLSAEDIAETVEWAASRPPHVNLNLIELMPTDQSFGSFQVNRKP